MSNKVSIESINTIAKDLRYEALYWALNYFEYKKGIFTKQYSDNLIGIINAEGQLATIGKINIKLVDHKSFVILECIDKALMMGYSINEIVYPHKISDIKISNLYINCFQWGHLGTIDEIRMPVSINYSSRLISGIIQRKTIYRINGKTYKFGIFENDFKKKDYIFNNETKIKSNDFEIEDNTVIKYLGKNKRVIVPEGIKHLGPCLFWDNTIVEEVVLPNSLEDLGGDTFYNCFNLKRINIPKNVKKMGNNPFAGCPKLILKNNSNHFIYKDGALYDSNFTRLYYFSILSKKERYEINPKTKIIGKHSFYLCRNLKNVTIPKSVIKLENNPFSGCDKISLINNSNYYHILDNVIYDKEKKSIIGCLNSIKTDELKLLNVERICRNSFWNCKGIKKIIFPSTLKVIGYNPFVGCSNIHFVSKSPKFKVVDDVLYNEDKTLLICYPAWKAKGDVRLLENVSTLERGSFSGCDNLKSINFHNVSFISKSCFTNCNNLTYVYCSDLITYIGEWAFAHCKKLKELSISKNTILDNNVLSNSPAKLTIRKETDNYLIESENLYTLKSLQNNYKESIDSILIDPPYNSNINYIGYKDNHFKNGYKQFLLDRLGLAKNLLSKKGFLVINIDEGGLDDVKKVCNQLFKSNCITIYKWKKKHPFFDTNRVVLNPNKKQTDYENIIICKNFHDLSFNKIKQPYIINNKIKEKYSILPKIFDCFGTTSSAKDEIKDIFGKRDYFSTPKPVKLMMELIRATTNKDSIVLDFFAGSGTVGEACHKLNKEDKGDRNFILVSNNESDICNEVTKERLMKSKIKFIYLH